MELLYVAVIFASFSITPITTVDCKNDVCALKGFRNVACLYVNWTLGPKCKKVYSTFMTDEEKDVAVTALNEVRMKVAMGLEKRGNPGPQPAASNMRILVWDAELAFIAQRWLNQCLFYLPNCVDVGRFEAGQFFVATAINADSFKKSNVVLIKELIEFIHSEVEHVNASMVCNYRYNPKASAFIQTIWAKTYRVGCGKIIHRTDLLDFSMMCVFGPRGNVEGQPVYQMLR
ncbi:venom allergen 3-like [Ceratina calcarata]|uniref:Venom allergen 3-like n=1 Tax=Ceratina calcarata TaxID=156304 RepID=A0AAJ7WDV5_9HYME|nr:venom allergen 3-like [Ceratina calcarata]